MSKIADTEANATSLDSLVNDNALVPTLRNGPKPSYQYLVDGWNTEFDALIDNLEAQGDNAIALINADVVTVEAAKNSAISSIDRDLSSFDAYYQSARDTIGNDVAEFTIDSDAALADFAQESAEAFNEFDLTLDQYKESRGFNTKGAFADGFTYELPNDVGIDADGNPWILIDTSSLPVIVSAGTTPSNPPYKQVSYGTASQVSTNTSDTVQSFVDSFALKIFQSPTDSGLTEIQTRTVDAGEVYEVRNVSDSEFATIYSNSTGTIQIPQNGTINISDSAGVVEFYIADGDYYIETGSSTYNFSVGLAEKDSVSEVKKTNYKAGTVVTTSSYYSKDELSSFGLSAPYGGGARYLVVPSAGLVEDTVKYHQMDNGLFLELLDVPNSRNAGFVGNYIDELSKGFDNAEKLEALNSLNESLGGANRYHAGNFYVSDPTLELTCDSRGEGNKATKFYIDPPSDNIPISCIKIADNCTVRDIEFNPSSTDSTKTWIANKFSSLFAAEFEYNQYLYGMNVAGNCVIIDCVGKGFRRGLQGVSGTKNVSIIGGEYWGADWGTSFYNVELLSFDRVTVIGGNIGGMGMPSCRHVTVGGNCIVYNPNGTGINTGGSSAEGFNAEDINIASCTVYARDCINLENGCVSAKVSGYKIYVITEIVQNGVGVGVFSRADNSGGLVGDIHIGPGFIEGAADGNGTYSHAVKVGYLGSTPDSSSLENVSISGVSAIGSRVGCEVIAPTNTSAINISISGNSFKVTQTAIALTGKHESSSIDGGNLVYTGDTVVSGTYGVRFGELESTVISGVKTQGFGAHYRQDGAVLTSYINSPNFVRGKNLANVTKLSNSSGAADMPINNDITV